MHKSTGGTKKRYASVGDKIVVTVKHAIPSGSVKKGSVSRAVVVRTKKEVRRKDGSYIRFEDNAAILLSENDELKGTRVFGPVARAVKGEEFYENCFISTRGTINFRNENTY